MNRVGLSDDVFCGGRTFYSEFAVLNAHLVDEYDSFLAGSGCAAVIYTVKLLAVA